jgi:hypothetical protein
MRNPYFFPNFKWLKSKIFISFIVLLFGCAKKKMVSYDHLLGLDYYPTSIGKYVIYDVDSIIYSDLPRDTVIFKYRIKEKLADTFTDNEGNTAFRLERYIKMYDPNIAYDEIPWSIKEVWFVNADKKKVQVVEGNVRFTKLIFPIEEKAGWNGNAANTLGKQTYIYDYIDKSENINGQVLNNVLKVKQKDFITHISHEYHFEKYAKNIGLVYREIKELFSNNLDPNVVVLDRIEYGYSFTQTFVSYGFE